MAQLTPIDSRKVSEDTNHKWLVLLAIGIGTFMSALDGSVVNLSLPLIGRDFGASVAGVEWVVTIYLLMLSGLQLTFGRLGDLRGHKNVYLTGFLIFVVSSILCGAAPTIVALIAFRVMQSIGAAMLASNSPAIITKSFPTNQRGQALGLQATMTYLGLTVGPSLGGWLTGLFSWRAVFYINIPVGLAAFLLSWRFIHQDRGEGNSESFDIPGALLFMVGLIGLLFGLNRGAELGWLSSATLAVLAGSLMVLGAFVRAERRTAQPMLDLRLFRERTFTLSVLSAILNYVCIYSIIFLMPFYLIRGRQFSPGTAGLILTAQPIIMAIVAPISGTLSDRIGARLPGMFGMATLSAGLYLLSRLGPDTPVTFILLALAVTGLGTGAFISPNNSALMGAAPKERQGIAAGVLATARNFGMALGVGLAGAVFNSVLAARGISGSALAPSPGLFTAFQASFLVAAGIGVLGIFTSAIRQE